VSAVTALRHKATGAAPDAGGEAESAVAYLPARRNLPALRAAAQQCKGCHLWRRGTQTVFGEGAAHARVMLVGEQPGDAEDRAGRPFVGPAGRVLDRGLEAAGVDRGEVYVTNVVKHFKWEPRGKRRLHQKPNALETRACLPWLEAEAEAVKPEVLVCLGATAAQALLGRAFRVSVQHGQPLASSYARVAVATVHPSSILRAQTPEDRERAMASFVADLKVVARLLDDPLKRAPAAERATGVATPARARRSRPRR
jgi:DNA polymerase